LVAMWYQVPGTGRDLTTWSGSVQGGYPIRGTPSAVGQAGFRALPLRPVWAGLAADALVFAAAWFALLVGVGAARRARRRRRGLCEACGYDRRGLAEG